MIAKIAAVAEKKKFSDRVIKWKRLLNNRSSGSYLWDNDF